MTTTAKGLGHGAAAAGGPPEDVLPGWRAACAAYRAELRKGHKDPEAHRAAVAAYMTAMPGASRREASDQAVLAVHWASVHHNAWLYDRSS